MESTVLNSGPGRARDPYRMTFRTTAIFFFSIPLVLSAVEQPPAVTLPDAAAGKAAMLKKVSPELKEALGKLDMPGVKINPEEWCVDVEATVCLHEGMLELIACTKDTKEHESIIRVDARPSHIHTALLLLRAKPGHPAMHKAIDKEGTRFIPVPPTGGPVDVFLVFKNAEGKEEEHPISDFIGPVDSEDAPVEGDKPVKFPTHTFLFAGSVLNGEGKGPRTYVCDQSGSVISIATFGDELLCLPGIHDQADSMRMWQVNGEKLPPLDSKITLRLRPQVK